MNSRVAYTWLLYYKARPQILLVAQYRTLKKSCCKYTTVLPCGPLSQTQFILYRPFSDSLSWNTAFVYYSSVQYFLPTVPPQ